MGLGDELMVSGHARVMQRSDPRRVRVTYHGVSRWSLVWQNNPRIVRPEEVGNFQELPARGLNNLRPYHLDKTRERYVYNLKFRADVGEIYFSDEERSFGAAYPNRVIFEPNIKLRASPNKQWGWSRWQRLANLFVAAGMPVTQLGAIGTLTLDGVEFIETPTFRMAAAVIAMARGVVLPEGGTHHAAAALGVPGVVIFGGFTPVELTGYPVHRNLGASLGDACGMRLPCPHCADIMASITPGRIFDELRGVLRAS